MLGTLAHFGQFDHFVGPALLPRGLSTLACQGPLHSGLGQRFVHRRAGREAC